MAWPQKGNRKRLQTVILSLASIQILHLASTEAPNPTNINEKLASFLSDLLQDDGYSMRAVNGGIHRFRRHLTKAEEDHIRALFNDPLENPMSIDKYINSEHIYNLSSAEKQFYRQQTYEFHRHIFNRFDKWQQRSLNESMIKLQHELEVFADKNQLQCEKEFQVPAREGLKMLYRAMGHYREEMLGWVKHTFVDKPKTLVREEKVKLEAATNETLSVRRNTLRSFWQFERRFANMMRFYEQEMTDRMLEHYDKVILHYMDIGDKFVFPRTLPNLLDHLADNSHLFTLDLRNETTTEYCMISPAFSLDSEQHKAAVEQQKFLSNEWA